MRLADFLDLHRHDILAACEKVLATGSCVTQAAPGEHAPALLAAVIEDLREQKTAGGEVPDASTLASSESAVTQTVAQSHGAAWARHGGSASQLFSHYRALRAVSLRLWAQEQAPDTAAAHDAMRFNAAVDRAVAQALDCFDRERADSPVVREAIDRELMLNRARLEYASRLSNVGFWYCDLPFDVLEWDERVKEHFFLAPSAVVTIADFYDRIHPEDRARTKSAIDASIASRQAYDIVYRTCDPASDEVKFIRALGGTDYASDGSPIHFDGLTVDVTAKTLEQKRVADSEARHRGVIANMDEAFTLFDADFNIIDVNDAACQLVNIERSRFVGVNHWQQFPGTYESELGQLYRQVQVDGQPRFLEHQYVFEDGRSVWFEVRAFKVGAGVAALFRDVTERVEMISALQGADRRKDEFLAMLAHELRNPLAPIMTAGEILARSANANAPAAAAVSVIQRQTRHMTRLIDDLLDVARVTQGRIQLQKVSVNMASVLAQALEICESQLRAKQQHLTMSTDQNSDLYVEGDAARLTQCVANILSNAIKYTDPHGEISVSLRRDAQSVIVVVTDSGSGIPAELLPQIFELFVQSQRTLDRSQGGLGVGLAIVKRLVEMHGGRVRAYSAGEGAGSTFEIRLPLHDPAPACAEQAPPTGTPLQRILLVDDNVDAAQSLAMLLEMQGHVLLAVHSARAVLDQVEAFRPDTMLIDIGLPEMDGYALVQELAKRPAGRACRKIALTGYGQPEDKLRALSVGFDAHLVKPVNLLALEDAIAGVS